MLLTKLVQRELYGHVPRSFITTLSAETKRKTNKLTKKKVNPSQTKSKDEIARRAFQSRYRTFLRAGAAAVTHKNKKNIKSLIREGFERKEFSSDPELEVKVANTLELLRLASEGRGLEHTLVNNLCQLKYFKDKDNKRPPFYNRKFPPQVKEMHETCRQDLELTVEMLNKDLKLFLI